MVWACVGRGTPPTAYSCYPSNTTTPGKDNDCPVQRPWRPPVAGRDAGGGPVGDPVPHAPVIRVVGVGGAGVNAINRMVEAQISGVEFMAINTDWDVPGVHNVKLVGPIDGLVYPIPYDMDWSGIINNRYAKPDPSLGIRSNRDRLYRGFCRPADHYDETITTFNDRKSDIYELFRTQEGLDPDRLERAIEDLDEFYEILAEPRKFKYSVLDRCRRA